MVNLVRILEIPTKAEVRFVLVGGAAAYAHGSSLTTQDLDIGGALSPDNTNRLAEALAPYHPRHRISAENPRFTVQQASQSTFKNLYLTTDIGQVDFRGFIKGVRDYAAALDASEELSMENFTFRILSIRKLIEAKDAMGRPRDLETASNLKDLLDEQN